MRFPFIILIWILTSSKAIACTCSVPKSLKAIQDYEYEISECIFIGEVLEIDSILSRFTFKVLESFKGLESGTIYIGKYDPMCGLHNVCRYSNKKETFAIKTICPGELRQRIMTGKWTTTCQSEIDDH